MRIGNNKTKQEEILKEYGYKVDEQKEKIANQFERIRETLKKMLEKDRNFR